eukprot:scaffold858_cov123-Cylindrotheca_fusiformis.AAC.9
MNNSIHARRRVRLTSQPSKTIGGNLSMVLLLVLLQLSAALISPNFSAEHVVREQLNALKEGDAGLAYRCYSPDSKDVIGGTERFSEMVHSPPFETLVEHRESQILMTSKVHNEDVTSCLVKIVFASQWRKKYKSAPCLYFVWELSREDEDSPWFVDAFMPDFDDMDFEAIESWDVGEFQIPRPSRPNPTNLESKPAIVERDKGLGVCIILVCIQRNHVGQVVATISGFEDVPILSQPIERG